MNRSSLALAASAAASFAAASLLYATPAAACGGFFCNNNDPVNQTGEEILFAVDGENIEAHVAIQYAGPSEEFAWIVPTPSRPEVGVSSSILFTRLDQILGAQFRPEFREIGECSWGMWGDDFDSAEAGAGGAGPPSRDEDGVTVVEQNSVGPYDYAILQATAVEPLFEWLEANDYDIPRGVMPFVEPYVLMDDDMHFVSFRLSKDRDAGDIQPVLLSYTAEQPVIPIQLTAVATVPDMGVRTHILGDTRSVPENYLHVEINEARIDWLNYGSNYNEVVTAAMDEAGGQAFVTEYAVASSAMADRLWQDEWFDTDALRAESDPIAFWNRLMDGLMTMGLRGDSTILGMLQNYIPLPEALAAEGVDEQSFYNCMECYREYVDAEGFDAEAFVDELEIVIFGPLEHAQELFDTIPYTSRLYTTLSAEEMTIDPAFAFNPDMDDVANVRTAEVIVDCGDGRDYYESPITIRLNDGREIRTTWDVERDDLDALPAADTIEETGASGAPRTVSSNRDDINAGLEDWNDQMADVFNTDDEKGCSAAGGHGSTGALAGLGLLLGLGFGRRRRR